MEGFPGSLQSIGKRSEDSGGGAEKTTVKINHTEELWKSRLVLGWRKITDGGGVLGQRMQASTGESMSEELGLRHGKLTLAQANCQSIGAAQLQDVTEMLNMRG